MAKLIADLHIHSKYSRAVSSKMVIPEIAKWARLKGIDLVGTADWTHPVWVRELKSQLIETAPGIFQEKTPDLPAGKAGVDKETSGVNGGGKVEPRFLLVTELSSIYSQGGKGRRIHTLVFAPSFEVVEKINAELARRGVNLMSDGRPIMGLSVRDIAEIVLSVSSNCLIVPSHLWTPWFGTYGDKGGFDSLEEAYRDLVKHIHAIETGHSSDPAMNWRISELDSRTILSFSDAHSPPNMSREATVFEIEPGNLSYSAIREAIVNSATLRLTMPRVAYTIEFYPQEGKYHYTGHRNCGVKQTPEETKKLGETCPVCGRPLTVGVMHRVEQIAQHKLQTPDSELRTNIDKFGVKWINYENRPPYVMLVPLIEIIGEVKGVGKLSKSVMEEYMRVIRGIREMGELEGELGVLLETPVEEIAKVGGEKMAEGILRVRSGQIHIEPGFDGVYGKVQVWPSKTETETEKKQMSLF